MKFKAISLSLCAAMGIAGQVYAQGLEATMAGGNSTSYTLRLTGTGAVPTSGSGLELAHTTNGDGIKNSYIQSYDRSNNTWLPLNLESSLIRTLNRVTISNSTDDGFTPLQVNGAVKSYGGNFRAFTANVIYGYGTVDIAEDGNRRVFMGFCKGPGIEEYGTFGVVDNSGNERGLYIVRANGNVGIGTTVPKSKLSVNGNITCQRVKVTIDPQEWADFVFAPDYQLPTLTELENYIRQHQHLPDIPTAAEVAKNDVDLGEMNKKLLQKVEELTLYIIQQQKEIEALKDWKQQVESKK
ncbi:hypothetical protein SAMN05444266_107239 [Chitinophaga jiangningensis]|uniref:Uncharacterized protein n=1 Tax=Chitinophaga jiangningensis TaxID=1419482 RepID=A0A1M7HHH1_9BACT|nr:hypothetical protein [Chitinophaga jiangningensis]SHM27878.1 hypothetical protein SAMN05444266_107239 [Chitinophaga jiangningensis]